MTLWDYTWLFLSLRPMFDYAPPSKSLLVVHHCLICSEWKTIETDRRIQFPLLNMFSVTLQEWWFWNTYKQAHVFTTLRILLPVWKTPKTCASVVFGTKVSMPSESAVWSLTFPGNAWPFSVCTSCWSIFFNSFTFLTMFSYWHVHSTVSQLTCRTLLWL